MKIRRMSIPSFESIVALPFDEQEQLDNLKKNVIKKIEKMELSAVSIEYENTKDKKK